jgi:hypothetical protein
MSDAADPGTGDTNPDDPNRNPETRWPMEIRYQFKHRSMMMNRRERETGKLVAEAFS